MGDEFCKANTAACNGCRPRYCLQSTMGAPTWDDGSRNSKYFVEELQCPADGGHATWEEHTFVLYWAPEVFITWLDPTMAFDDGGSLVAITPKPGVHDRNTSYHVRERSNTPLWLTSNGFIAACSTDATAAAPFDKPMNLILNIAVGGYGGAECSWGTDSCTGKCLGALGAEMVVSDIKVWQSPSMASVVRRRPHDRAAAAGAPAALAADPLQRAFTVGVACAAAASAGLALWGVRPRTASSGGDAESYRAMPPS